MLLLEQVERDLNHVHNLYLPTNSRIDPSNVLQVGAFYVHIFHLEMEWSSGRVVGNDFHTVRSVPACLAVLAQGS